MVIIFGLAGAMVPGGMRRVIVYLIENRLIDVLVSTGANLFHDVYETSGQAALAGQRRSRTTHELGRRRINRFYDVLAPESDFSAAEEFVTQLLVHSGPHQPYTTREYFRTRRRGADAGGAGGGHPDGRGATRRARLLAGDGRQRARPGDRFRAGAQPRLGPRHPPVLFDIIGDVLETAHIAATARRRA